MSTLLLTDRDVYALLPMTECIAVMERALKAVSNDEAVLPLRTILRLPGGINAFGSMPATVGSSIGAKIITVFPGNDATPFDSHIGVVLLFGAEHGELKAIADASSITAIRTAAVSGVATKLLARPEASSLAVLGAGVLALHHVDAVRAVRPITKVTLWSRSGVRAEATAAKIRTERGIDVIVSASARGAVEGADVVCTITSSRTPILEGTWLAPGSHVNAVGASLPTARELDTAAVASAKLYVDRRESTLNEAGDFLIPRAEGAIDNDHILGELGELLNHTVVGRRHADDRTLFKSLGLAVEDVAALQHIFEKAERSGAGTMISLGGMRR